MNLDDKDKHVRTKGRTRKGSIELKEGYGKQVLESVNFYRQLRTTLDLRDNHHLQENYHQ